MEEKYRMAAPYLHLQFISVSYRTVQCQQNDLVIVQCSVNKMISMVIQLVHRRYHKQNSNPVHMTVCFLSVYTGNRFTLKTARSDLRRSGNEVRYKPARGEEATICFLL